MPAPPPLPPPTFSPPPPLPAPPQPAVVRWFRVYCWVLIGFMILAGVLSLLEVTGRMKPELSLINLALTADDPAAREALIRERIENSRVFLVVAIVALPALAVGVFATGRSWGYGYAIFIFVASIPLCLFLPAATILFVFWLKPEVAAYFRVQPAGPSH